jgi:hypothetical protein
MALRSCVTSFFVSLRSANPNFVCRFAAISLVCVAIGQTCAAQNAPNPPDVLVLSNGDTLHGKFVDVADGKVTFHSDPLGDVSLNWDKVKELHTTQKFAVIPQGVKLKAKKGAAQIPIGPVEVIDKTIAIHPENAPAPPVVPLDRARYVVDQTVLDKEFYHRPGFFQGWNGAATAGASIVAATQHQYAFSGAVGLIRVVPTVKWLQPRNRTSIDFTGNYGRFTQPAYTIPATPGSPATFVPSVTTKTAIYHADAERDEYFSPRFYALALIAFDHNFSQDLDLQQIYGGGLGWTAYSTPKQELDLKGTIQYEKQQFISSSVSRDLVGSTVSADYILRLKMFTYTQNLSFIPAYNDPSAYSVSETNTVAFHAYKSFSFSLGTLDSYFNNPPAALPPTKRNSFQFTMGLTYAVKSKY